MGYALAARAFARGAHVTLVTGPASVPPPIGPTVMHVETTADMQQALERLLPDVDVLLMAAAPSDYRLEVPPRGKRPRADGAVQIELHPTADILAATVSLRKPKAVIVGFALETGPGIERARVKLDAKRLDLVVLNRADELGSGFEVDTNRVTLVSDTHEEELPLLPKAEVADRILDAVEARL
jgi:phosphopantothenoylcysteine decarboxylase/phosphopantothenate--cysteine ligase